MVCAQGKGHVQTSHDEHVSDLRGDIPNRFHHGKADRLQGGNVAAVEVVEIGVNEVGNDGGNNAIPADKEHGVFPIAPARLVNVQRHHEHKGKHGKVMEGDGVEGKETDKEEGHLSATVDQVRINSGQHEYRCGKAHRNACHLLRIFAAVKGKCGQRKQH